MELDLRWLLVTPTMRVDACLTQASVLEYGPSDDLSPSLLAEVIALCDAAYEKPTTPILAEIGPGVHVLGRVNGRLVTHAMTVTRFLQMAGRPMLRLGAPARPRDSAGRLRVGRHVPL